MALRIRNEEACRLAQELAAITGESLTDAVVIALRERLDRQRARHSVEDITQRLRRLAAEVQALPVLDARSAEEIVGYDERGLPA
jgi:antitoxin VapB